MDSKTSAQPGQTTSGYIESIRIDEDSDTHHATMTQRDLGIAIRDLKEHSSFQPANDTKGPYDLALSIQDSRLVFEMTNTNSEVLPILVLSLKPYKRLIQDYFMMVNSYEEALVGANPSRIEAIDMGRSGLHNEGAEMVAERLADKIKMDDDTARRLFTLICVLHDGKALQFR
jgi:uncharacterized protein (UPF0262 family)